MRLFIAVNIPGAIKEKISRLQDELKKTGSDVKWVEPGNLHLTLKFIGETSTENIDVIETAVQKSISGVKPFNIKFESTDVFPGSKNAKVLWAGVSDGGDKLKEIVSRLRALLSEKGFEKDKNEFSAHVTLGRIRSKRGEDELLKKLAQYKNADLGLFTADKIDLMQSILRPEGSEYKCLKSITIL